jgi:hypothetical protein
LWSEWAFYSDYWHVCYKFSLVIEIEPRIFHMLNTHYTTELYSSPQNFLFCLILFYHFYIYLHVYMLFWPPSTSVSPRPQNFNLRPI